jgi:hypothetical protein
MMSQPSSRPSPTTPMPTFGGRVFVDDDSDDVEAYQATGRTKCFVRVRAMPMKSQYEGETGSGKHVIGWDAVGSPLAVLQSLPAACPLPNLCPQ